MENKYCKFAGVIEEEAISISKYNAANGTKYYLFDPDNITNFKSKIGKLNGDLAYLFEYIQVMWGNDEIHEYVILDKSLLKDINLNEIVKVKSVKFDDVSLQFAMKKSFFGRYKYYALLNIKNTTYYLYIKTISGEKRFEKIIEEFLKNPINQSL